MQRLLYPFYTDGWQGRDLLAINSAAYQSGDATCADLAGFS
jgi:hypothetical protein